MQGAATLQSQSGMRASRITPDTQQRQRGKAEEIFSSFKAAHRGGAPHSGHTADAQTRQLPQSRTGPGGSAVNTCQDEGMEVS